MTVESSTPLVSASAEYFDLGKYHRAITTKSQDAQVWFNRGLIWSYSFNHAEAVRCFEQVIAHDRTCAMGYWGIAYASGPTWNRSWTQLEPQILQETWSTCRVAIQKAKTLTGGSSAVEKALIEALALQTPTEKVPDDFSASLWAYANGMRRVYQEFGEHDIDVITLMGESLMLTSVRQLFDKETGEPNLNTPVLETRAVFEKGLQHPGAPNHVGILHLYIHLMERSSMPEAALTSANYLRLLAPDAGHIHHMPSHIDLLLGDYRSALKANASATIADDRYFAKRGACNFYSFYRSHDYHSLIFAAMMSGQRRIALESVDRMEATMPEELFLMESPRMVDWVEYHLSIRVHVYIRFGMWEELKVLPVPKNTEVYCCTIAMTHYGRALAWAATGNLEEADRERDLFREAAKRVPPSRTINPNKVVDVLAVASAMVDGEVEYRRGNFEEAFKHLRLAVARDDSLLYAEPWPWMVPTRHAYGALSLEQGLVEQAAVAYAQDLGLDDSLVRTHQHPNSMWALRGYQECLERLGRHEEAEVFKKRFEEASAESDINVVSSCFCRLGVESSGRCVNKAEGGEATQPGLECGTCKG